MRAIHVSILAALAATMATQAMAAEEVKADAQAEKAKKDELICKTSVETGSLAKRTKKCYTRAEWAKINDAGHAGATDLVDRNKSLTAPAG